MNTRVWVKCLCSFCFALCLIGIAASAQDTPSEDFIEPQSEFVRDDADRISDERLERAMTALSEDGNFQQTRPEWEPETRTPRPQRDGTGVHPLARAIASFLNWLGQGLGYLLVVIIVVAILTGLFFVFGERLSLRGRQKAKPDVPDQSFAPKLQPAPGRAQALLSDAEALAAEGRFAEAVHLLLFRSISDLQDKRQGVIEQSLTAREIGALEGLPQAIRDALSPIIAIVERSFFGGQSVSEQNWQEARQSYERFAFGEATA